MKFLKEMVDKKKLQQMEKKKEKDEETNRIKKWEEEFNQNYKMGKMEKEQENEMRRLIEKYKEICAISDTKLGRTNIVKHEINTGNHKPIAQKPL